jgi:serine/threonine-protein kinase
MDRSLDDLLLHWEAKRAQGVVLSAHELCPDAPELAAELERRIRLLERVTPLLTVDHNGAETQPELEPLPATIAGFEVRRLLGRGAQGIVYHAWDPILHRDVALKILRLGDPLLDSGLAGRLARRFLQEIQILAQLKHEHIVPIYEAKLHEGVPYFVMEYEKGGNLRQHAAAMTAAGPRVILPFVEKVARALEFAHGQRVFHRDLKPANIFLNAKHQPLVGDFGLAKLFDPTLAAEAETAPMEGTPANDELPASDMPTQLTAGGQQPGTPPYMAPEQFDPSFGKVGPVTDIWALGVILYELLLGQKPFQGETREALREQVCRGDFIRPRVANARLRRRIEAVILRCLAKSPEQRYPSAGALAQALAACQKRPMQRLFPGLAAAVGVLGLLIAAWAAGLFGRQSETGLAPPNPGDVYLREVGPILERLEQEDEVDLVNAGPEQRAVYFLRSGGVSTKVSQGQDGLNIFSRAECCLVELLPYVPTRHYRLTVEMRSDWGQTDEFEWGVYCKHTAFDSAKGQNHHIYAMWLAGGHDPQRLPAEQEITATLMQRIFCDFAQPAALPFRDMRVGLMTKPFRHNIPFHPNPDKSWQTIAVQVDPSGVTANCTLSSGENRLLGPLKAADSDMQLLGALASQDDLRPIQPAQLQGSALGVFVRAGVCTVRKFVVHLDKGS